MTITIHASALFAAFKTATPLRCIIRNKHTIASSSCYRHQRRSGYPLIFLPLLLFPILGRTSSFSSSTFSTSSIGKKSISIMSAAATNFEVHSPSIPDEDKLNNDLFLEFVTTVDKCKNGEEEFDGSLIIGFKDDIEKLIQDGDFISTTLQLQDMSTPIMNTMLQSIDDEKKGGSATTYVQKKTESDSLPHQLVLCSLPTKISRNNHPMSVHTITTLVNAHCLAPGKNTRIIMVLPDDSTPVAPLASAIAKGFPIFSKKTSSTPKKQRKVSVAFISSATKSIVSDPDKLKASQAVSEGALLTQRLVDIHPEQLTTDAYAKECENIVQLLNQEEQKVTMKQIVGEDLNQMGFGGLYGVGKAATCPPRFIILEYTPTTTATETIALVGKGILYDTGGLSLKPKVGMCGMKHDMGGSAGMLGAFYSAVKLNVDKHVYCLLCVAENAIGPTAFRNDDILTMYSGKTVEVNNCDAEGRLVLGDGVAYASCGKHLGEVDCIIDMATLTGAQLVTTGKRHASILCNKEELEGKAFKAGMHSGDLCFPILYCPELLMDEFKSAVADMKNSVKDRSNAQCSCAGHFIEAHLDPNYKNGYIHVDMAGPASKDERGTGYGVGLILALLNAPGF